MFEYLPVLRNPLHRLVRIACIDSSGPQERQCCMFNNANGRLTDYKSYRLVGLMCPDNMLLH
jgi:hypothetical protein